MIRRIAALTTAVLLAVAGGSGAWGTVGMPDAGAQSHAAAGLGAAAGLVDQDNGVALDFSWYGPSVLTSSGTLRATMLVANTTGQPLRGLEITMAVTVDPLRTRASLAHFAADPTTLRTQVAATKTIGATGVAASEGTLPAMSNTSATLQAGPVGLGMAPDTSGVYGVVITVTSPAGVLATRTAAVTWYDAAIAPLRIAFVATASGSPERVSQVASAASVGGAALALDPVQITDDELATSLARSSELFALPSGDPDLASLAHAENTTLLDFALTDAATNVPTPLQKLPWLANLPVVDQPTVASALRRGALAGIVDVASGAAVSARGPVVDVTSGGATLPVLVPDRGLSQLVATYRPGAPDSAAMVVADSALLAASAGDDATVVVAPGAAWNPPESGPSHAVTDLLDAPWVVPVTVRTVINSEPSGTLAAPSLRGIEADMAPDLIKALDGQLADLEVLAVTAENPDDVLLPGARTLLAPLAVRLRNDPETRTATYVTARDEVRATIAALEVASGSDVNLIAASGNVPVTLHNGLPVDATVTVVMRSSSPNLVVQDAPVVTIPAGGDIIAYVPVTAVKSANVATTVALHNADGDVVASPQLLKVRVRADWGNAMTAIFTAGLVLLLVAGLIRTVRRGRRSSRMAPVHPGTGGDGD